MLQRHDLLDRPEHRGTRDRAAHVEQLTIELQDLLVTRPTAHWVAALDGAGMPGWPVLTYSEALAQAQVAARDMVVEIEHPVIGPMHALGLPAKLSETPASVGLAAPLLTAARCCGPPAAPTPRSTRGSHVEPSKSAWCPKPRRPV